MKEVQNGSLYYNEKKKMVVRPRGKLNSQSVVATHHDDDPKIVKVEDLRIASSEEVNAYLEESSMQAES